MGKKGSWFSALKRAFTPSSKTKDSEKKTATKEKTKWGLGKPKHGEANSFVPLYRAPSSIEKILGDAEREQHDKALGNSGREQHHKILGNAGREQHDKALGNSEREQHHKILGNAEREQHYKILGDGKREQHSKNYGDAEREDHRKLQKAPPKMVQRLKKPAPKPAVTPNRARVSAIKIQAAYKGYMARRSYRALKGLVRLQGVMRGQSVKRQTMNTLRCMQLLVRVQSQIRARRLQVMEGRNLQQHKSDKEAESSLSKWSLTHQSEAEANEEWEDSVLTKEEIDGRTQRKVEAVIKRERALAYAYSHQTPKSSMSEIRSGAYTWLWNWLDRPQKPTTPNPAVAIRHVSSPRLRNSPKSSNQRVRACRNLAGGEGSRDDDSLVNLPAMSAPRYMSPTASATARIRRVYEEGRIREGKGRFGFGFGTSIGSVRSLFAGKDPTPARSPAARHRPTRSIGGASVDSTVSLPVGVGRKAFR